ncbi:hypothetical protein WN55_02160, partial [Dufourea novaeangliae]
LTGTEGGDSLVRTIAAVIHTVTKEVRLDAELLLGAPEVLAGVLWKRKRKKFHVKLSSNRGKQRMGQKKSRVAVLWTSASALRKGYDAPLESRALRQVSRLQRQASFETRVALFGSPR